MRRNFNLELHLVSSSDPDQNHRHSEMEKEIINESPQQRQQLTIFYNGRVCVSNATELQARAIILLASREMEEKLRREMGTPRGLEMGSPTALPSQLCSPSTSVSMKRSIQRFLQKRNNRIQSSSPYNH